MAGPAQNFELPEYTILDTIHHSKTSVVYLASHNGSGREVALKTIHPDALTDRNRSAVSREFKVLDHLRQSGVVDFAALDDTGISPALITSHAGTDLNQTARDGLSVKNFLKIAVETGACLGAVHQAGVIHQNIMPGHVLWNSDTQKAGMIDFSLAALPSQGKSLGKTGEIPQPSLAYISPEMTGRMNREIDYRTDYYSLGITFYEVLTGKTPFRANDAMGWFHAHIAKKPSPPSKIRSGIPPIIDEIILKLMSKDPEDRYQSSQGLISDLERVRTHWDRDQSCDLFELGRRDIPKIFHISQKMYGRKRGKDRLLQLFNSAAGGNNELALVSGFSGIGKSTLVNEIQKRVMQGNGIFISGKSNPLEKTIPFYAIVRAFRKLVGHLLAGTGASLEKWRAQFMAALGTNGKVVLDVIPEMASIIGPQPAIPKLNPEEEQNRFLFTFRDFLKPFGENRVPLVLFLDDLQWSDTASFKFLRHMATDAGLEFLFIIGAYRNNEVGARHPLTRVISEVEQVRQIHHIPLNPLDERSVKQILTDSLHFREQDAGALAKFIFRRTHGNPFFLKELLQVLHREDKISFRDEEGQWRFDLDLIEKTRINDNIADFLAYRLKRLPESSQRVLGLAACMGGHFQFGTILELTDYPGPEVTAVIRTALQDRMIVPLESGGGADRLDPDSRFRFYHDQIQEAAYFLVDREARPRIHLKIGRLMREKTEPADLDDTASAIVTQLNKGISLMGSAGEKEALAGLNLRAGRKAAGSIAYQSALEYFLIGLELLPDTAWTTHYDLQFALMKNASVCSYLVGNLEQADAFGGLLKENARTGLEKAEIAQMQVVQYEVMEKLGSAIETGMEGLACLGVRQSARPGIPSLLKELVRLRWNLRNRDVAELIHLKILSDPKQKRIMELLVEIAPLAYMTRNDNLVAWITFKLLNITLQHGQTTASVYAYVVYGMFVQEIFGRRKSGYQFGKLALEAADLFKDEKMKGRALFCHALFIHHWNHPWESVTRYFKQVMDVAYKTGDMYYLVFSSVNVIRWNPGLDLQTFHTEQVNRYSPTINSSKYRDAKDFNAVSIQMAANLLGLTRDRFSFSDNGFDETDCLERMLRAQNFSGAAKFYLYKMQIHYLYGDPESALRFIPKAGKWMKSLMGIQWTVEYCLFSFLIRAALYPSLSWKDKLTARLQMQQGIRKMAAWSDHFPLNYLHHLTLMKAELARISNGFSTAVSLYDRAVQAADNSGHLRYQALTRELAGRFHLRAGHEKFGRLYLEESWDAYSRWGAKRKFRLLEEDFPFLAAPVHPEPLTVNGPGDPGQAVLDENPGKIAGSDQLDLASVIKASQSISREVNLEKLLTTLIHTVMENAGAQRVVLLLEKEGRLVAEAEGRAEQAGVSVLKSVPLDAFHGGLPLSVIEYTAGTRKSIVANDAKDYDLFQSDPYIRSRQLKSMLCLPITATGKSIGILYMENNLTTAVFTPGRVRLLTTISAQAAISIENARLFRRLARSEKEVKTSLQEKERLLGELEQRILEQNKADQENLRLEKQLLQAQKMESIGTLAGGIAHDFNNILFPILGHAEMLLMDTKTEDPSREGLTQIYESAQRAKDLVNQILAFSRRESRELKILEPQPLVKEILKFIRSTIPATIDIVQDIDPDCGRIKADPTQLHQIVVNLATNAYHAIWDSNGKAGSGKLTVSLKQVALNPPDLSNQGLSNPDLAAGAYACLTVTDTGAGMDADLLEKIFDPFFTTKEKSRGTGMGLAVVHGIVKSMNWDLKVASEPGKGSEFRVCIPLENQMPESWDDRAKQDVPAIPGGTGHILLVDDELSVAMIQKKALERLGYRVTSYTGSIETLEAFRNAPEKFDLVITDMEMPQMQGDALSAELHGIRPDIPVLLCTGYSETLTEEKAAAAGISAIVTKPLVLSEFARIVRDVLEKTRSTSSN